MNSRSRDLVPGDVVLAFFPRHEPPGHEQEGPRPAIVVGIPDTLGHPRFPTVFLVPLTTDHGQEWAALSPALYPRLSAGTASLPRDSLALLDQARALTLARVISRIGALPLASLRPIQDSLHRMLAGRS